MLIPHVIRLGGLVLVVLSVAPAVAWSPAERASLRWPWLPLAQSAGMLVTGLLIGALGAYLPYLL